ncbi:TPA: hypothetical protein RQN55_004116 [Aeromonas dhakensis]|nr:hypothetical protein [Aeromonas dhakensis]
MTNPTDKQQGGDPPPGGVQSGVQDGRRTSFVLHLDTLSVIEKMTREQRGDFLTGLYRYRMGEPLGLDPMMEMVLHPFMAAMDRDDEKFATRADRSRANGSRGGRPRKTSQAPENPENPVGFSVTQKTCEGEGEGEGDEKGKEKEIISTDLVPDGTSEQKKGAIPCQAIIDLFNEKRGNLPKVTKMTATRQIAIKRRWDDKELELSSLAAWGAFFDKVSASAFLQGWKGCGLDWLLEPKNAIKVLEGNYSTATSTPAKKMPMQTNYANTEYQSGEL